MLKTRVPLLAVAALAMIGIAGCSPTSSPPASGGDETTGGTPAETPPAEEPPASDVALMVASTDLGDVVVDANGMTVYMFDKDTKGTDTSACTGQCLEMWPPVFTESEAPTGTDVTGEIGTIMSPDGKMQVTLNGWPVYLWANDKAPGDVSGQGVGGVWWVLDPAGEPIKDTPSSLDTGY